MDFAPYQSSPPEHERALSPPPGGNSATSPRASLERRPFSPRQQQQQQQQQQNSNATAASPPPLQHPQPQRQWSGGIPSPSYFSYQQGGNGVDAIGGTPDVLYDGLGGARGGAISEFDTSLGLRLDYEACLAYLAVPPLGSILLLILERKSDYVRFHAWQASLLFTLLFVVHLVFSWSRFLSWVIFLGDLALMAWLTLNAYRDADTLDRFEVPIIGPIASKIVDDE